VHSTQLEYETSAARWRRAVETHRERPFLTFEIEPGDEQSWSYGEFDEVVARTASGMAERGVGPGDVVHLVLPNSVAFVAVWLACARLGATFSCSDPRATAAELGAARDRLRPVLAVCGPEQQAAYSAVDTAASVPLIVTTSADPTVGGLAADDAVSVERPNTSEPGPADRLAILFTSGTTSAPKGVELTQANYALTGDLMAAGANLSPDHRWLVVLPLFHANAQYYCFSAAISVGASVALMPSFSASRFLDQAVRHEVTHTSLFAAPIRMILARTSASSEPVALTHAWFAQNLTGEEYQRISALLGCRPRQIYGMTETGPAVLMSDPDPACPESMGRVTPGCEVRLRSLDGGGAVASGSVGEIQVGGQPGRSLFAGYLDDPVATAASIAEQGENGFVWFATGDRAEVDEDGNYYFAGRGGDQLKVAGENVSVVEIEQAIAKNGNVFEVAVVGRPDPTYTEVPVAFVVPRFPHDAAGLAEAVRAWCAEQLAPMKRPHEIHIVDELPRTSVGKIRKFLLTSGAGNGPATQTVSPILEEGAQT